MSVYDKHTTLLAKNCKHTIAANKNEVVVGGDNVEWDPSFRSNLNDEEVGEFTGLLGLLGEGEEA